MAEEVQVEEEACETEGADRVPVPLPVPRPEEDSKVVLEVVVVNDACCCLAKVVVLLMCRLPLLLLLLLVLYAVVFNDPLAVEVEDDDDADEDAVCISLLTIDAVDEGVAFAFVVGSAFLKDVFPSVVAGVLLLPRLLKGFIYEGIMLKIFSCSRLTTSSLVGWRGDDDCARALPAAAEDVVVAREEEAAAAVERRIKDCICSC